MHFVNSIENYCIKHFPGDFVDYVTVNFGHLESFGGSAIYGTMHRIRLKKSPLPLLSKSQYLS